MIIKKIKIQNIRSYKEAEIIFPEGSTLLSGDIGSGKTSILLAVEFALFGLQPGQKGNSIMRSNETESFVSLELEIDEQIVIIERGLKKSGKSINQTDVSITVGEERFEGSVTEVKNKILTLLNYPAEFAKKTNDLYRFTVYTPQEEMKQIVLESDEARLNTLRHIFGIDKYKRIEENITLLTSKIRQEIRIKEAEMGNIEQKNIQLKEKKEAIIINQSKIKDVDKEKEEIKKIKTEKQIELDELTKKINERNKLENEKDKSELTLANKKDLISSYERDIKLLREQIKSSEGLSFNEREIEVLKNRIKAQEQLLKELNDNYIITLTSIQGNEQKIKGLKMLKDKISSLDKCTTCLQIVNDEHKKNIVSRAQEELMNIDVEFVKNRKDKEESSIKIEQTRKLIDSLKQSLSQMEILKVRLENIKEKRERIDLLEKQRTAMYSDLDMLKKHIEGVNELLAQFEFYNKDYELRNREFQEIVLKENRIVVKKIEIEKEIQFLERQIVEIENEIKRIEELAKKMAYMRELEFWLNNKFIELVLYTEKNVMLRLREDFSNLFSNWFSTLVADNLNVRLDESFSPIIQQNDYELDYSYLSGGERTAVALAYRLALTQTINSLLSKIKTRDIVILDEPTDGFSESQLDKMRDVLNQLKVRQLILVSHEQKIDSFVDNIIRFTKKDGVSSIEAG